MDNDLTTMFLRHHWNRRCRAAIFFVPLVEYYLVGVAENGDERPITPQAKVLVERLFATAAGSWRTFSLPAFPLAGAPFPPVWPHSSVEYACRFMDWCGTTSYTQGYSGYTSGSLNQVLCISSMRLQNNELSLKAAIEAISYDLLDDHPDPDGLQDALRALLRLGRLATAVQLADRRLPKPAPVYRNEPAPSPRTGRKKVVL